MKRELINFSKSVFLRTRVDDPTNGHVYIPPNNKLLYDKDRSDETFPSLRRLAHGSKQESPSSFLVCISSGSACTLKYLKLTYIQNLYHVV